MARLSRLGGMLPLARWFPTARHLESTAVIGNRGYGTAAAAALDFDDYYFGCEDYWGDSRRGVKAVADSEVSPPERGLQWVVIGEPGAKKHIYADWLSKLLNVPHISLGNLVQQELNPKSSLYKQIEKSVNQGKLVPEDVIFKLLSKRLEEGYSRGENGFILEGIPRTRLQAEILDEIADIDLVLNFKCSEDGLIQRPSSDKILKIQYLNNKNRKANPEEEFIWKQKLDAYAEQNKPVEDYYRYQRKLLDFKVASAPGETWRGLLAALHLQHLSSPHTSPQKLTV